MKYPAIDVIRRAGDEPIINGEKKISDLLSFWQWAYSDLIGNTERGALAEYLVACALDISENCRTSWDRYDLKSVEGVTVEVKASGYLQTWNQEKLSNIQFGISETFRWDSVTNTYAGKRERQAKVYVFCVLNHTCQDTLNPLDIGQWDFYILPTETLNERAKSQKTIGLNVLIDCGAKKCEYGNLRVEIGKYAELTDIGAKA
jgi:hypothetical protein